MANDCLYKMKVSGSRKNVKNFFNRMSSEGLYKNTRLSRVSSCICEDTHGDEDVHIKLLSGNCDWSMAHSMLPDEIGDINIVSLSKKLKLTIEAYSKEQGGSFQEYLYIDNGRIIEDETLVWNVYSLEELEENKDYFHTFISNEAVIEKGITEENYRDFADNNGDIEVGGFGKWPWKYIEN